MCAHGANVNETVVGHPVCKTLVLVCTLGDDEPLTLKRHAWMVGFERADRKRIYISSISRYIEHITVTSWFNLCVLLYLFIHFKGFTMHCCNEDTHYFMIGSYPASCNREALNKNNFYWCTSVDNTNDIFDIDLLKGFRTKEACEKYVRRQIIKFCKQVLKDSVWLDI